MHAYCPVCLKLGTTDSTHSIHRHMDHDSFEALTIMGG